MNILHILNVADWALMGAGVAAALVMMVVGAEGEPRGPRKEGPVRGRRRRADRQ
jgi:hypothetical protein